MAVEKATHLFVAMPRNLHTRLKVRAAEERTSIMAITHAALENYLAAA